MACVPKLWDVAKGKAYERSPLAKELNMYLDSIRAKLIRIHRDMEQVKDKTLVIHQTMTSLEEMLPKEAFFRIHKSFLVNAN